MEGILEREIAAVNDNLELIKKRLDADRPVLEEASSLVAGALESGGKLLVAGNGGSAADAQHFAAELVGRYAREGKGLPAIALTTDTSALTAIGNDFGFDAVFERQLEALGRQGDVLIAISTSGNSPNIVAALLKAREMGVRTVLLTGGGGGKAAQQADIRIVFPAAETPRVQEYHSVILHILAADADARRGAR